MPAGAEITMAEILLSDIRAAAKACTEHGKKRKEAESAEAKKKSAMMKVFEPLLGVKTEEEVAALSPAEIKKLAKQRHRDGLFTMQRGGMSLDELVDQVIQKTQSRRSVSWKDAYINELGASKATALSEATDESFSYKFVISGAK
jgi:hypothetical protein